MFHPLLFRETTMPANPASPADPPAVAAVAIRGLGQIAIIVHDTDRAVDFYRDVLGLRLLFRAPPSLAFFDCGGVRLMLTPPDGGGAAGTSILFYTVDDIQRAYAWLSARGVRFDGEPRIVARMADHDLRIATFRDSEGNVLGLMTESPR
jgi:methylmalonyl-CoA/ethylmalonyl-CoA epimerase